MVRVVRLPSGDPDSWPSSLLDELSTASLHHGEPTHPSFEALARRGLRCDFGDSVADGTILLIPSRSGPLYELAEVLRRLLAPGGCPWDRAQTHDTLKKYLIEEAYELCDAIDAQDEAKMLEELGDVLLQPFMHSEMKSLNGAFTIDDVAKGITDKLIRRHPHVFSNASAEDEQAVLQNWDAIKRSEKGDAPSSILEGVPSSMPGLLLALEISKRAARAGFEWQDLAGVLAKLDEEVAELKNDLHDRERAAEEIGDLLFTVVNIARWLKVDPEESLRQMVRRFRTRFEAMENATSRPLGELSPQEWDDLWETSKSIE